MGERFANIKKLFVVHPDMVDAFRNYRPGGENTIKKAIRARRELTQEDPDAVYWNADHDVEMAETARQRTIDEAMMGNKWPEKGR